MCGICGIWGYSDPIRTDRMIKAMHHRGPDDVGSYADECISMGMARLAILDLSPAGHQPMATRDQNIWIVYNGEVYNFQSERKLLETQGYEFKSHSDTEVILRLYEKYGDDFLLRLRGMFALAIYDKRRGPGKERLILARDQFGIKPLLYTKVGKRFLFASEIKALLASGYIPREIDPVSLRLLLTFGSIYQPRTILRDIHMLPPAHRLVIENGQEHVERYWAFGLDRYPGLRKQPYEELVDCVASSLEESVRLQMISDVPVGAFLSGGVDSSFTVGLMTRIAGNHVKTFSVGFEAEGSPIDETDEAERTARFLGADHTKVIVRGSDLRDHLTQIITGLDQPSVDGVNSYFVSMAARKAVTVAISGTGGDELFAGYPWFTEMAKYAQEQGQLAKSEGWYAHIKNRILGKTPVNVINDRERFLWRYALAYNIFGAEGATRLLDRSLHISAGTGNSLADDIIHMDELFGADAVERVTALCLRGYTNNQLLRDIDAMSMAHSLEVRVPFLDVPLLDLSLSMPPSAKLNNTAQIANVYQATYRETGSKKILVDAGKKMGILREDIDLQPKRGFTFPMEYWLKNELCDVMDDTLSSSATRTRGLFSPEEVNQVRQEFLDNKIHWTRPWLLMMTELWAREILD
ncbi:MAG TPA: asparagine synthase (glutamine-hydrolyzing) [Anaerolineales bacterium]|nr:asparagine synthase (glutamine-hydrolyzing) [Anaerolineales bacterium]